MEHIEMDWAQPPRLGPRNRARQIDDQVTALRAQPGEWAVMERSEDTRRLSNAAQPYRARGCQITVQNGALYVRWVK